MKAPKAMKSMKAMKAKEGRPPCKFRKRDLVQYTEAGFEHQGDVLSTWYKGSWHIKVKPERGPWLVFNERSLTLIQKGSNRRHLQYIQ